MIYLQSLEFYFATHLIFQSRRVPSHRFVPQCHTFFYSCFGGYKYSKYATEKVLSWVFPTSIHGESWVFSTHGKYPMVCTYGMRHGFKARSWSFLRTFTCFQRIPILSTKFRTYFLLLIEAKLIVVLGRRSHFSATLFVNQIQSKS